MARYYSVRQMKAEIGEAYNKELAEQIKALSSLGYEAIFYAYRKGHTDAPKQYRMVPRTEDGEIVYYKTGSRRGRMMMRKSPIPDGKWRHRTRNLHDSFGSAVYYGGVLIKDSVRFVGKELTRKKDVTTSKTGRETLLEFFNSRRYGKSKQELVLVCVAAMHYTKLLEKGLHRGRYKIQVISAARDYIDRHWKERLNKKYKSIVLKGVGLTEQYK